METRETMTKAWVNIFRWEQKKAVLTKQKERGHWKWEVHKKDITANVPFSLA